jgi:general nucleoside transport system permease protein
LAGNDVDVAPPPSAPSPPAKPPLSLAWLRRGTAIANPILGILAALAIGAILIAGAGANVGTAYGSLWQGAFGDVQSIGETVSRSVPLLIVGLATALSFRAGAFNIGGEGQLYMGALASVWAGVKLGFLPGPLLIAVALLLGLLAGFVWGGLAGAMKSWRGVNEVISTILLNYIAIQLVSWLVHGPLQEARHSSPQTDAIAPAAQLPALVSHTNLHAGVVLALLLALAVEVLLTRTTLGFAFRSVGFNPHASAYAGINVRRVTFLSLALSGAVAAWAGSIQILGVDYRLLETLSPGWGYTGIAVALLGGLNPLGVVISALFFGALATGGDLMQAVIHVPVALVNIVEAIAVLFVVGSASINVLPGLRRPPA